MDIFIIVTLVYLVFKLNKLAESLEGMREANPYYNNATRSEVTKLPDVVKPDVVKPDVVKPDVVKPESVVISKLQESNFIEIFFRDLKKMGFQKVALSAFLKIGVISFIIGISLFLKYSIDHDWIPVWGRATIGIIVGSLLLLGGVKIIKKNEKKVFSESLFGAGISILYLSVYAAYSFPSFKFVTLETAFFLMVGITSLAGTISVKYNSLTTSLFGLAGGFFTPFLLNSSGDNIIGLLGYYLILNVGILYISIFKKWNILLWLAFIITSIVTISTARDLQGINTLFFGIIAATIFVMYSISPFLYQLKNKIKISSSSYILFTLNVFVLCGITFDIIYSNGYPLNYSSFILIPLSLYLIAITRYVKKTFPENKLFPNIILIQAMSLLAITTAIILDSNALIIALALESLCLIYIGKINREPILKYLGIIGFSITSLLLVTISIETGMKDILLKEFLPFLTYMITIYYGYALLKAENPEPEKSSSIFYALSSVIVYIFVSTHLILHFYNNYSITPFIIIFLTSLIFADLFPKERLFSEKLIELPLIFIIVIQVINFAVFLLELIDIGRSGNWDYYTLLSGAIGFIVFSTTIFIINSIILKDIKTQVRIGIASLGFIVLNILTYYTAVYTGTFVSSSSSTASYGSIALTLLWLAVGVAIFFQDKIKQIKSAGIALISIAILKAFIYDMSDMDSIFKIILFLVLGISLFAFVFFYQKKVEVGEK